MTSLFARWTFVNMFMYLAVIYTDRRIVDDSDVLYCSADNTFLIYIDKSGVNYMTLVCLQFLFVANMIKVVLYEGVCKAKVFGD